MKESGRERNTQASVWIDHQIVNTGVFDQGRVIKDTFAGERFVELWREGTKPQRFDPTITSILIPHLVLKPKLTDTWVKGSCNSIFQQDRFVPTSPEQHSDKYHPTLFGKSTPKQPPLTITDLTTTHYLHSDDISLIHPRRIYLVHGKVAKLQEIIIQEENCVKMVCADEIDRVYRNWAQRKTIVAYKDSDGTMDYDVFDHDKVKIEYGFLEVKQAA